ncbi:MAG TPA: hypothetical protein VIJ75_13895, partial [Hanamia sp.]
RNAIVQAHCHHRAIMKIDSEEKLLKKIGLDYQVLDSGCCGMAGYFGYLKGDKYEVSVKAGERVLLPAVRGADSKTLVISNGYSCREQIEQLTDREGMHIAQVLQMALHENGESEDNADAFPERKYVDGMKLHSVGLTAKRATVMVSLIGLVAVSCLLLAKKRNKRVKKYH